ncbi:hypothetical protein BC826DRAFT_152321 [Russula brevipes]|nr:hypothetical protein BC826DRAFT_152321 [Russula brevipes]
MFCAMVLARAEDSDISGRRPGHDNIYFVPSCSHTSISAVLASEAYRCKLILQGLKQRNETSRMWMRTNNLALSSSFLLIRELGLRFQSTFPHELPCILGLTGCGDITCTQCICQMMVVVDVTLFRGNDETLNVDSRMIADMTQSFPSPLILPL